MVERKYIRNFSIIAHIDHGKSTIADRLLELTNTVSQREMKEQLLDSMDLEREKGITIKAHPVTMQVKAADGNIYQLNLIDTPGHVDFTYEVSRSLTACEGALLVVDAGQGVQAQSMANVYLAIERNLEIIPIINKIDLPQANPEEIKRQIEEFIGLDTKNAVSVSAKLGIGIEEMIEKIVQLIPPPKEPEDTRLRALVFDSHYDSYRGVMVYVRLFSGNLKKKDEIILFASRKNFEILEVGIFTPKATPQDVLRAGEVGYFIANIKTIADVKIGDTIGLKKEPLVEPLQGFKEITPVVYAGIYPVDADDFDRLKDALYKLRLNDSALSIEQESSQALGFGFRCGFLGLLHLEIIFERITRHYDVDVITTTPGVVYRIHLSSGEIKNIDNAAFFPDPTVIEQIEEPWAKAHVMMPKEYMGAVMNLSMERRGVLGKTETLDAVRVVLTYAFPLNEIITDFNDKLKSVTRGYGSFDYEFDHYEKGDIIKLEIRVNEEPVDAFSCLVHRSKAEKKGRELCEKLAKLIPQHLFKIPVQASIGGKIITRETIRALSKNVTAKCYGGDITRKRKLWEKQKKGKKKMKEFGKVQIPHFVFMQILKSEED